VDFSKSVVARQLVSMLELHGSWMDQLCYMVDTFNELDMY
jgi:hypothetical protein